MDKRFFKAGEKVFNLEPCAGDSDLRDWAAVCQDTTVEKADEIVLIEMQNGGENETTADSLYQIAEGKFCPRCGEQLCVEHHPELDYPYYCPQCDENFYNIEI